MLNISKETRANLEVIKDPEETVEVKAFIILELLHNHEITLTKAKHMFTEIGIFSEHWIVIDSLAVDAFSKKYKV